MFFCGIDVGTTHVKLTVYDEKLRKRHREKIKTPISSSELGDVLRYEDLKKTIVNLLARIPKNIKEDIIGIGISSLGETVFPVGPNDEIYDDGLMWYNDITREDFEYFRSVIDQKVIFERTGIWPSWVFSIFKMMNFYKRKPDLRKKDFKWLDVSSTVAYILTRDRSMDISLASRTLLVNLDTRDWDPLLTEKAGIPRYHLPPLIECGMPRGTLKGEISKEISLNKNIVVTTAGHDHITAAYAMNVYDEKKILNSSGTTETVLWGARLKSLKSVINSHSKEFQMGIHAFPNSYYILGGIPTGGFALDWFLRKVLRKSYSHIKKFKHRENFVFFFPYLRGGFADGKVGGAFMNLRDHDDDSTLISSILESLAFEMRTYIEKLLEMGFGNDEIIVVGGGATLKPFLEIKAGVFKRELKISKDHEATSLGATMLAMQACGMNPDLSMLKFDFVSPSKTEYFDSKYHDYLNLKMKIFGGDQR